MKIQVLGSSCPNCKIFFNRVQQVLKDLKISDEPEYIDDISKLIGLGVLSSPALVVDAKVILAGGAHTEAEIKEALRFVSSGENLNLSNEPSSCSYCSAN